VDLAQVERTEVEPLQALRLEALDEVEDRTSGSVANRADHAHGRVPEASERKLQRSRARRVEQLSVVDRDQQWRIARGDPQCGEDRGGQRSLIERRVTGRRPQHCHLECVALEGRQPRQYVIDDRSQQIAQRDEREPRLGGRGCGGEHVKASPNRLVARVAPERALADSGRALDHEPHQSGGYPVDQPSQAPKLRLTADDRIGRTQPPGHVRTLVTSSEPQNPRRVETLRGPPTTRDRGLQWDNPRRVKFSGGIPSWAHPDAECQDPDNHTEIWRAGNSIYSRGESPTMIRPHTDVISNNIPPVVSR
jgi:hypothetical protein